MSPREWPDAVRIVCEFPNPWGLDWSPRAGEAAGWSNAWIPFATNAAGDSLCVDAGPTKKGKLGQLLWWYHDEDFREREAEHLTALFSDYAKALSEGELTVRPDGGIIGDV